MNISDLISLLQYIQSEHGDLPCMTTSGTALSVIHVEYVSFQPPAVGLYRKDGVWHETPKDAVPAHLVIGE